MSSQNTPASKATKAQYSPTLISEKTIGKPLFKILSRALAAHLVYPKIAVDFRQRGTVKVAFMLYPNGLMGGITVIKSSGFSVLDDAALTAVNGMAPVAGVQPYVKGPMYLVAGVIFE